jgi:hypothetical protein
MSEKCTVLMLEGMTLKGHPQDGQIKMQWSKLYLLPTKAKQAQILMNP